MSSLVQMNGKRALITGITGQDGSYLVEFLLDRGYEVWGVVRRSSLNNTTRIQYLLDDADICDKRLHLLYGDLTDTSSLYHAVETSHPHEVYNLGAQSHVQVSFEAPDYTAEVTGLAAVRLLEAIRDAKTDSRFYQASSSELFGKVRETPQTETTPFHPRSPYAAAKAYAFYITRNYRESYEMFAVNGILFNHESPRRGETFVTRKITRTLGRILSGQDVQLVLGNLDAQRDWGFAGDYVEAMWLMLQAQQPEDFVIATGKTYSVRQFCEAAFDYAKLPVRWEGTGLDEIGIGPDGRTLIRIDRKFFRPAEVDILAGDASRAKEILGWQPKVDFQQLVEMMVDSDREKADNRDCPGTS